MRGERGLYWRNYGLMNKVEIIPSATIPLMFYLQDKFLIRKAFDALILKRIKG